jgi:hypothetical protein
MTPVPAIVKVTGQHTVLVGSSRWTAQPDSLPLDPSLPPLVVVVSALQQLVAMYRFRPGRRVGGARGEGPLRGTRPVRRRGVASPGGYGHCAPVIQFLQ